jgi:hypothetical protein
MNPDRALEEELVRRIFGRVLDRLDELPSSTRKNPIRIPLDDSTAPEIILADSLAAREVAWAAIDSIVEAGWTTLGYRLSRRHGSREDRRPFLDFQWPEDLEDLARSKLNRRRKAPSYASLWKAIVARNCADLPARDLTKLAATPIEITGRDIEEVFSRFMTIRSLAHEPLLLREVASRSFWGLSKVLDGRADGVAALLGVAECPFPEQPIVLSVHSPARASPFLFVENHVAFERAKRRADLQDAAIIFSSGFRAAAKRLRRRDGCSAYYTRNSTVEGVERFETILFSADDHPVFFWGDLDFAGMAILASLRTAFPSAAAWEPGYEPMFKRLLAGDGHSPAESGKLLQRGVDHTGCAYADNVLIPAIRRVGLFVDQE